MAHQEIVRALAPRGEAERLREELLDLDGADVETVTLSAPEPTETYRGEDGDLELHDLVRYETLRLIAGGLAGAVLGALVVAVLPWFHEWLLPSMIALTFGGAALGAIVAASFGVQVDKRNDALPDTYHEMDQDRAEELRVLTVVVPRGRTRVVNHLEDRQVTLLDSWDPKVGPRERPEKR